MKQSKVLGIVLAIVNVILIIVCVLMYMRMDRTEPKLEFHTVNMVYRQDMDITELRKRNRNARTFRNRAAQRNCRERFA